METIFPQKSIRLFIFSILMLTPYLTFAHPGRTDSYGCHTCKTNCPNWGLSYGEYHCHNGKALPQPEEPIHSFYGESGTGYTVPAPEYKNYQYIPPPKTENKKDDTSPEDVVISSGILGAIGWYLKKKFFS